MMDRIAAILRPPSVFNVAALTTLLAPAPAPAPAPALAPDQLWL
jgi:hypothetical protein